MIPYLHSDTTTPTPPVQTFDLLGLGTEWSSSAPSVPERIVEEPNNPFESYTRSPFQSDFRQHLHRFSQTCRHWSPRPTRRRLRPLRPHPTHRPSRFQRRDTDSSLLQTALKTDTPSRRDFCPPSFRCVCSLSNASSSIMDQVYAAALSDGISDSKKNSPERLPSGKLPFNQQENIFLKIVVILW